MADWKDAIDSGVDAVRNLLEKKADVEETFVSDFFIYFSSFLLTFLLLTGSK